MPNSDTVYLMISGAITAYRAPELVAALSLQFKQVLCVQTPNAARLNCVIIDKRLPNRRMMCAGISPVCPRLMPILNACST
jgi:hypothetical protein